MATIDIRNEDNEEVQVIVFGDEKSSGGFWQANRLDNAELDGYFFISDSVESVVINSKDHAHNLIKALNKAIELGWVK